VFQADLYVSGAGQCAAPENLVRYLVAVKVARDSKGAGADDLIQEASVMIGMPSHRNVMGVVGMVSIPATEPLMLLLTYCEHGSLLSYLKGGKDPWTNVLTVDMKRAFAADVSCGMAHLAAHRVVHRDLAARNVLVKSNRSAVVADFGLSRKLEACSGSTEYYKSVNGVFAPRWTSPEALEFERFDTASDCWSFGMTVLEIFQDGRPPMSEIPTALVVSPNLHLHLTH
jgi:serine/threonine protein kinase